MWRTVLLVLTAMIGGSLLLGCRADEGRAIETNCDASLRMRAEEMARAGDPGPLEVLGSANGPIDEPRRRKLL